MLHQVENSYEKTLDRIHVCKISMFTYVKNKAKLTDMSKIDEHIWIHVIDIYDMKNKAKYSLSQNISKMIQWIHHEYVSIQILLY